MIPVSFRAAPSGTFSDSGGGFFLAGGNERVERVGGW